MNPYLEKVSADLLLVIITIQVVIKNLFSNYIPTCLPFDNHRDERRWKGSKMCGLPRKKANVNLSNVLTRFHKVQLPVCLFIGYLKFFTVIPFSVICFPEREERRGGGRALGKSYSDTLWLLRWEI